MSKYKDSLTQQRDAAKKSWERFLNNRNKEWGLHGHDMGIHDLNLMLGGWIPGKVTTIAARSGIGKTAITVPIFDAAGRVLNERRAECLVFSWEMDSSYLVDRHICYETGLSLQLLNQGAKLIGEDNFQRIQRAYRHASELPIQYQQHSIDINEVKAITLKFVEECREKEKIEGIYIQPVIIIDYIGMAQFEGSGLRTYGIAEFMNGIKQLVNMTGASALVLSQINRAADDKKIPDRTDISDSQSIEQASDNLVLLHRPEYNNVPTIYDPELGDEVSSENKMLLRVLKGRDYGTGDSLINCDIKHFQFWNRDHQKDFKYWELYNSKDFWVKHFKLDKFHVSKSAEVA